MIKQVLYCDICGKEVDKIEKYVLPMRSKQWIVDSRGIKLAQLYEFISPCEKDVCNDCASYINDCIRFIKHKEDGYRLSMNYEKI